MSHDTNFFLLYFKDKIPKDSLIFLKESLEKASEEQKEKLLFTKLKNPLYGLLFAFLLPGLDRIYNGNIIVGGKIKCRKRKIKCRIFATNYLSFNLKLKL
ncbi:hypothetical protein CIB68_07125 [Campylobacter coli]|nr:hypothetical protein [Campylobacter coli]